MTYNVVDHIVIKNATSGDQEMRQRGGWPAREPEPGERVPLSWRVTPQMKNRLAALAAESGRSLMQECELRLEQSFDFEATFGGSRETAFMRSLAAAMTARYGDGWADEFNDEARDFLIRQLVATEIGRRVDESTEPVPAILQLLNRLEVLREAYLQRLQDPAATPRAPRTLRLMRPIVDDHGGTITEITLQEPTVGEMEVVDDYPPGAARGLATVAVFARLPVSVIERLYWSDLWRLDPEIAMLC